jgi:hypothetical protein
VITGITQLTAAEARIIASRQLLTFLFVPSQEEPLDAGRPPSKDLFSVDQLPDSAFIDKPGLFDWRSRPIFDVERVLVFWDHTLSLGSGNELFIRTAASDVLRTPAWSIAAGRATDVDELIDKALAFIQSSNDLKPVPFDTESTVRVVCYGYPRLGILCSSEAHPNQEFVVDLMLPTIVVPVVPAQRLPPESVVTVWSPYDSVTRATLADYRSRWERDVALLPPVPTNRATLRDDIQLARRAIIEERTTNPELGRIRQDNNHFCAAATAEMILQHYGFKKLRQADIAHAMNTSINGATPQNQQRAIRPLSNSRLQGVLDQQASFSDAKNEICNNRPFKVGVHSHARACGGYKIENGPKEYLYMYDPLPTLGGVYYEPWEATRAVDFMYVKSILHS